VVVQSLRGSPCAVNTRRARAQTNPVHGVVLMELCGSAAAGYFKTRTSSL
jgi:hypothetical protein